MTTTSAAPQRRQALDLVREVLYPWRWYVLAAVLALLAGSAVDLVPPLIIRALIDDHISVGRADGLVGLALLYLGATIGAQLLSFVTTMLSATAAMGGLRELRVRVFEHLERLPIRYHDRTPVGDAIARCTADVETLHTLFSAGVFGLLAKGMQVVATLVAMIALSLPLSLILLALLPLIWWITQHFQRQMRTAERLARVAVGRLNAQLQEALANIEIIHALRWERVFVQRFRRQLAETLGIDNRSIWVGAVYSPIMNSLAAAVVAMLFAASLTPWFAGTGLTVGTLAAFVMLFQRFFDPIISIGNEWQTVQSALAGIERIGQVLSEPLEQAKAWTEDQAGGVAPRVLVEGVTFGYAKDVPILRNVSLEVGAGEHIAIVGRTGAGKSSLFHLLGGLYQPDQGRIRLSGRDPAAMPDHARRSLYGTVPQAVRLFQGSVADNIAMHDTSYSLEQVQRAVESCGADGFVVTLPQGYDTLVGDMGQALGVQLSAGQRQLLALARALVAEPDILLLDEATAAIDSATEGALQATLQQYLAERQGTVITIAHRLSTAVNADRILVMERGRVVEQGAPQDLLQAQGHFAALWELEQAGWDWRNMVAKA